MALRALLFAAFVIVQIGNLSRLLCASAIESCQWLLPRALQRISRAFGCYNWNSYATQWTSRGTVQLHLFSVCRNGAMCVVHGVRSQFRLIFANKMYCVCTRNVRRRYRIDPSSEYARKRDKRYYRVSQYGIHCVEFFASFMTLMRHLHQECTFAIFPIKSTFASRN